MHADDRSIETDGRRPGGGGAGTADMAQVRRGGRLQCVICGQLLQHLATDATVTCVRCGVANACGAGLATAPRASAALLPPAEACVSFMLQVPLDARPLQLLAAVVDGQTVEVQAPVHAGPGECVKVTAPVKKNPAPPPPVSGSFVGHVRAGCAPPLPGRAGPEELITVHQSSTHCVAVSTYNPATAVAALQSDGDSSGGGSARPAAFRLPSSVGPGPSVGTVPAESKDDLQCSICFELLIDPIKTHCNHLFCRGCLAVSLA